MANICTSRLAQPAETQSPHGLNYARLRRTIGKLEIELGALNAEAEKLTAPEKTWLLMAVVQIAGAQEAIAKLLPKEQPTLPLRWRCRFWDGRGEVYRDLCASGIAELETKAYAIAYHEGWQMLGYQPIEEVAA